jgi:hypothetical protein
LLGGNQRTEARGLEKRCRSKGKVGMMTVTRVRTNIRIELWVRIRAKVGIKVEWVPNIYLVEINK